MATQHYVNYGYDEGRQTDIFNEFQYIASYGDLIAVFGTDGDTATHHYVDYGYDEGRTMLFDAQKYIDNYADLSAIFGNEVGPDDLNGASWHYIEYGMAEGRTDDPLMI
jgi:hypothetical protein